MNRTFDSSGNKLAYHLATPTGRGDDFSGLILCHGFPIGPLDARRSAGTFPELVDRIAHERRLHRDDVHVPRVRHEHR